MGKLILAHLARRLGALGALGIVGLIACVAAIPPPAHAQVYPVVNCIEYYSSSVATGATYMASAGVKVQPGNAAGQIGATGASGATGAVGPTSGGEPTAQGTPHVVTVTTGYGGNTGAKSYIGNFGVLNIGNAELNVSYGVLEGNFFSPGVLIPDNSTPQYFPVGYSGNFRLPMDFLEKTWFLDSKHVTFYGPGNAQGSDGADLPPPPTCPPAFVPATGLSFSQPGTYPQQFLGQVNAGPPANDAHGAVQSVATAVSLSPNVTLANVTYVANDPNNPTNDINPNSIYADVTITQPARAALNILVQLSVSGGATPTSGIDTIAYTGPLTTADATATALTGSSSALQAGQSATLTASVADVPNPSTIPTGAFLFYDTLNGTQTNLALVPASNGTATASFQPAAAGSHTLTAVFTPNDATAFGSSTASLSHSVFVGLGQVWALNAAGTVSAFAQDGSSVYSGLGAVGRPSTLGGIAIDASGTVWEATSHNFYLQPVSSAGIAAPTYHGAGIGAPAAVAIDGAGSVWVANTSGSSLSLFSNAGTALSGSSGIAGVSLNTPQGIAIDYSGNVWVANAGNNTVSELLGAAAPVVTPIAAGVTNGTLAAEP